MFPRNINLAQFLSHCPQILQKSISQPNLHPKLTSRLFVQSLGAIRNFQLSTPSHKGIQYLQKLQRRPSFLSEDSEALRLTIPMILEIFLSHTLVWATAQFPSYIHSKKTAEDYVGEKIKEQPTSKPAQH